MRTSADSSVGRILVSPISISPEHGKNSVPVAVLSAMDIRIEEAEYWPQYSDFEGLTVVVI